MGLGAAKLAASIGLVLGWTSWQALLTGTFAGFALAAVYGGVQMARHQATRTSQLPLAHFILLGALALLHTGPRPRNTCSGRCSMRSGLAGRVIPASPASSASEPRREGLAAQCPLHQFDPAGRGCQLEALFPVGREHAFDGMKAGRESYHTAATSSARSHTGGWPATGVRGIRKASMPGRYFTPIRSASHRSNSPATRA
jgi:hypothetical protein